MINFNNLLSSSLPVCCDTRLLQKGDVFVVIPCDQALENARTAVERGASALIYQPDTPFLSRFETTVELIPVSNARFVFSQLASTQYPQQPVVNAAVTGTNGKSSTVIFLQQFWTIAKENSASLGTLGLQTRASLPSDVSVPKLTTPDALSLHRLLDALAGAGVTHFAFEASSHGLDQYRLHHVSVSVAGFTNLTLDHLDYHGSMEAYFAAKARLFTEVLSPQGTAVLNALSPYFKALKLLVKGRGQNLISYAVSLEASQPLQNVSLEAFRLRLLPHGMQFDLMYNQKIVQDIFLPLVGTFQLENVLCAMGMALASGGIYDGLVSFLPFLKSVPGRLEQIVHPQKHSGGTIFVDYAHTPDALERALQALRSHLPDGGRLHVVFGCGGNRDTSKRALMGEIAQRNADVVYITDDNPRHEDPAFIRAQIKGSCPHAFEIGDRREAIHTALKNMKSEDVLLVAGKGHEQGQIIGDRIIPFHDQTVIQELLGL